MMSHVMHLLKEIPESPLKNFMSKSVVRFPITQILRINAKRFDLPVDMNISFILNMKYLTTYHDFFRILKKGSLVHEAPTNVSPREWSIVHRLFP